MSNIGERLSMLSQMRRKHLIQLRLNYADAAKDKSGSASDSLAGSLRFVAVADYVLHGDVNGFRSGMSEAAQLHQRLFERFDAGEPISPSYMSMMSYKALLDALAAADQVLAQTLAGHMGGREAIEQEHDRPFDMAFGYALKSIIANDSAAAQRWIDALEVSCREPENADFKGYAKVLRAIVKRDAGLLQEGLGDVVAGHKKQSVGAGLFKDSEDEVLCVWGIGLANLARMNGLPVRSDDPLIPDELIA